MQDPNCCGQPPTNLMPKEIEKFGVNTFTDMKKGLKDCDIVMMLRLQNERMTSSFLSSNREYYEYYGLTPDKLDYAKSDALMHFSWRLRSVFWAGIGYVVTTPLWLLFLWPGWIAWLLISIWFLIRVIRGFMGLNSGREMPL